MHNMSDNPFRRLPAVHQLLDHALIVALKDRHAHERIAEAARFEVDSLRDRLKSGQPFDASMEQETVVRRVVARVEAEVAPQLRTVINATGIVLHTNLGRSPMAIAAAQAAHDAARGYLNLELDLTTGKRSSRQDPIRDILTKLTGAESATAVNNCAAATVITLRALAAGKEVIVSRGQLIEIGGSFRIPEIMGVSGATLREVGTTNITRIGDYEKAIGANTAALMRVHTSNYRVRGFTEEVSLSELVELGRKHQLPVVDDTGSGAMLQFSPYGLPDEPMVPQSLTDGADLVLFSGDKLLGGPQAGIIVGKKQHIQRIEKDPLMRAFRLDKMTLAALEATLRLYLNPTRAIREVPTLRMLSMSRDEIRHRADALAIKFRTIPGIGNADVHDDSAFVGGGSFPDTALPTAVISIKPETIGDAALAERLRTGEPSVMARTKDGCVLFDLRTVFEEQEEGLLRATRTATST